MSPQSITKSLGLSVLVCIGSFQANAKTEVDPFWLNVRPRSQVKGFSCLGIQPGLSIETIRSKVQNPVKFDAPANWYARLSYGADILRLDRTKSNPDTIKWLVADALTVKDEGKPARIPVEVNGQECFRLGMPDSEVRRLIQKRTGQTLKGDSIKVGQTLLRIKSADDIVISVQIDPVLK